MLPSDLLSRQALGLSLLFVFCLGEFTLAPNGAFGNLNDFGQGGLEVLHRLFRVFYLKFIEFHSHTLAPIN